MPDFKKMNENEIRSYIRESESDIEDIEHNYRQEIEYESEQEAEIEREYFQLQNLLDSANSDPRLQGILCEGLDVISNIRQRRFELIDDLHNDKQRKIRESEENIRRLESRYIAKHNQKKDIVGIVRNGKLIMLQFVQIHEQLQEQYYYL